MRKALRRVENAISKLQQKLGRAPTEREIAESMGLSMADYHAELQEAKGYELLHLEDFSADGGDDFLKACALVSEIQSLTARSGIRLSLHPLGGDAPASRVRSSRLL